MSKQLLSKQLFKQPSKRFLPKQSSSKRHPQKISPKPDKISPRRKISASIRNASFGWLGALTDISLVSLYLLASGAAIHPGNVNRVYSQAGKLFTKLRTARWQKSLRKSLYNLADAGLIENWEITNKGFARLKELIPKYIEDRSWNGWLYLIIYDIPENLTRSRHKLRKQLRILSYGMLQESVWVSLDDPQPFIEDIIEMNELEDFVLILKTKPVGRARKNLLPILASAHGLENLNLRYEAFINQVKEAKADPADLAVRYLAILKQDPQLPFRLLPQDWLGDKAHQLYVKKILPKMPHEYGQFISKLDRLA